jgi:hypothetical protein
MDPVNNGWVPTPPKICSRCGAPLETPLYCLCDACHEIDALIPAADLVQRIRDIVKENQDVRLNHPVSGIVS